MPTYIHVNTFTGNILAGWKIVDKRLTVEQLKNTQGDPRAWDSTTLRVCCRGIPNHDEDTLGCEIFDLFSPFGRIRSISIIKKYGGFDQGGYDDSLDGLMYDDYKDYVPGADHHCFFSEGGSGTATSAAAEDVSSYPLAEYGLWAFVTFDDEDSLLRSVRMDRELRWHFGKVTMPKTRTSSERVWESMFSLSYVWVTPDLAWAKVDADDMPEFKEGMDRAIKSRLTLLPRTMAKIDAQPETVSGTGPQGVAPTLFSFPELGDRVNIPIVSEAQTTAVAPEAMVPEWNDPRNLADPPVLFIAGGIHWTGLGGYIEESDWPEPNPPSGHYNIEYRPDGKTWAEKALAGLSDEEKARFGGFPNKDIMDDPLVVRGLQAARRNAEVAGKLPEGSTLPMYRVDYLGHATDSARDYTKPVMTRRLDMQNGWKVVGPPVPLFPLNAAGTSHLGDQPTPPSKEPEWMSRPNRPIFAVAASKTDAEVDDASASEPGPSSLRHDVDKDDIPGS